MFDIDLQSRIPIYEQLYKSIVEQTAKKRFSPGDKLPSVRELAKTLGVNPNTVSKAFQMLERDGLIYSVPGRGSFISFETADIITDVARDNFRSSVREAVRAGLEKNTLEKIIDEVFEERGGEK